jgi:hypothetical protein
MFEPWILPWVWLLWNLGFGFWVWDCVQTDSLGPWWCDMDMVHVLRIYEDSIRLFWCDHAAYDIYHSFLCLVLLFALPVVGLLGGHSPRLWTGSFFGMVLWVYFMLIFFFSCLLLGFNLFLWGSTGWSSLPGLGDLFSFPSLAFSHSILFTTRPWNRRRRLGWMLRRYDIIIQLWYSRDVTNGTWMNRIITITRTISTSAIPPTLWQRSPWSIT